MEVFVRESVTAGDLGDDVPASLYREGEAMRNAVVADFERVPGVTVIIAEKDMANFGRMAARADYSLVIAPEIDFHLYASSKEVLHAGGTLLGSLPVAIHLTGDKLATAAWWKEHNVRHPETELHDLGKPADFSVPSVIKPRHGAGSQATFLVRNERDHARAWSPAYHESPTDEFIRQPFIRGQSASVALLISLTQTIPLLPARQRLSNDGRFRYLGGSLPLPEPLANRAVKLAVQAVAGIDGLQGYVGVDLVLGDDGHDYAIEINPRLTTSYLGLRQLCQQNLAELMLRLAMGEIIKPPTWHAGDVVFDVPR